ncbi:methyl-coenzyme M reductase [Acinetobacter sp. ANC 4558]|uniref:methyl-coenzyme M reductase n=1 Tax=Acinetobacter sp. ANC 4558 TaxID=1977876 RepID=UPI000B643EB6|nr:methyl-coenzyme M reductase [Acinetobacter sp. ANC 4558]OTG80809.1 methyl-coenzyme M reductase [Acinetobacter sp. ANC 4558]
MAKIPMGSFGNALPQVERIQMPQRQDLSGALNGIAQNVGQAVQQKDEVQRETEASAKRLELYHNQLAEQEAKIKLDEVLTRDMSEQLTLVKNDVSNGEYNAQEGDEALRTWSSAKYKEIENDLPLHVRPQLKQYWDGHVNQQMTSLLPLQLRADAQKSIALVDRATDIATRYDRARGREYIQPYLDTAQMSEAEKLERINKYETTRDILEVDDRIAVAVNGKEIQDLNTLISDLDSGKYAHLDGSVVRQKKNQALSRIDAINTKLKVEENKRIQDAGKVFNEFKSQVLTGRMLEDEYRNNIRDAVKGTEHEAEFTFYDKHSANFQSFGRLSTAEMQKRINQEKANSKNNATSDAVNEKKVLGVYESLYKEKLANIKANPNQAVKEAGLEVHSLTALDLKVNPSDFIKNAIDNGSSQLALKDANLKLMPISAEELPEVKKAFDEKNVDQKLEFIGGLIQQSKGMKDGRQIWGAILNQLGDGNQNYVAAGLAKQLGFKSDHGRELSTSIVNGTQLLKNKQLIMPKENILKAKFNEYLGNTITGTDANALYQTFKAVYADTLNERSIQHKTTDEDPKSDVLETALSFATGGVYTQSGKQRVYTGDKVSDWKISKPYGWKDEKFDAYLDKGYPQLAKQTGLTVNELKEFRLQRSPVKTKNGELQYDLINERGNPLVIKDVQWRIFLPGVSK